MNEETIDYRKLAEALAEALEQRNLWIEGEGYRELVILRMRLSARVDSLAEELKVANARIAKLEAKNNRLVELAEGLAVMVDWSGCDCDKPFILTEWEEFIAEVQE